MTTQPRFIVEPHIGDTFHVRDTTQRTVDSTSGEAAAGVFGPAPIVTVTRTEYAAIKLASELNAGARPAGVRAA